MFNKSKKKQLETTSGIPALISSNTHVQGNITCEGELQIDGKVTGDLMVNVLIIGQNGTVNGNIKAHQILIKGMVDGSIDADQVMLETSAKVHGDILHDTLSIDAGALIEGKLTHKTDVTNITPISEHSNAQ